MSTSEITTDNVVVNFYNSLSQFTSISSPASDNVHLVPAQYNANVVEYYRSGHSWYRIWSDGCIEQGGLSGTIPGPSFLTVSLLKPYSNTDYSIQMSNASVNVQSPGQNGKTTTYFGADYESDSQTGSVYWHTIGY